MPMGSTRMRPSSTRLPSTLAASSKSRVFDETQLNTQDGYVGFMLSFFRRLRSQGMLVFVCLHPNERWQLDLMRDLVERLVFVNRGTVTEYATFAAPAEKAETRVPWRAA